MRVAGEVVKNITSLYACLHEPKISGEKVWAGSSHDHTLVQCIKRVNMNLEH